MASFYLVSKRGEEVSGEDIKKALTPHCETPPEPHQTESDGLWAVEMDVETAGKLVSYGFSVQICAGG